MSRTQTARQDKEAEIFAAAVRIFQQKGYHAASMQDLADALGLQKASLYYYISSKEDLFLAISEHATGAFTHRLQELVDLPLTASEKVTRAVQFHVEMLCNELELFSVYLREQNLFNGREKRRVRAEGKRHAQLLESILEDGVRDGEFRDVDTKMTAHAIIGMCNWLYQWYSPRGRLAPAEIASVFADLVINGLKPRAPAAPPTRRRKKSSNPNSLATEES